MSSQRTTFISPEEYLAQERLAERKSEYFQGEIFAMSRRQPAACLDCRQFDV